eukprot:gnl/MRDRNA2_/MRDRNA2_126173_c0_seq1.p1 gnl/MRDRNA2_/MRDRNA2_126173_c0~~gnl/MRDRNA2_/MRDRNA2_126173_c0_seq1.p1  ORF type:complete len:381 (-),score=76.26 gnl/MRDRNA2_/MRDRNA2_126173_c0_seq1:25-1167(-)
MPPQWGKGGSKGSSKGWGAAQWQDSWTTADQWAWAGSPWHSSNQWAEQPADWSTSSGQWGAQQWMNDATPKAHRAQRGQRPKHGARANSGEDSQGAGEYGGAHLVPQLADVLRIRFSQEQIHPFFHKRGPIKDMLPDIENQVLDEDALSQIQEASTNATVVELVLPFEEIRCIRKEDCHGDLISLDNRRLYALQLAAVERWPARCVTKVLVMDQIPEDEKKKLAAGGLGPLGRSAGKPDAFMKHLCGDVEVLIADRSSSWEAWNAASSVLARCGSEDERASLPAAMKVTGSEAAPCEEALVMAREAYCEERKTHAAVKDVDSINTHTAAVTELRLRLEELRCQAIACPGVVVKRTGDPGDRDGYISVVAQAAALRRLGAT